MKKTQNRIISPHAGWRLCLYVMLVMFASCKSCKKEVNALPDATQTGANTAGCLIDGKAWIPNGSSDSSGDVILAGGYLLPLSGRPKNCVEIRMYRRDRSLMYVYVKSVDKPGRYPLSFDTSTDLLSVSTKSFAIYSIDGFMIDDPDYNYITTSQYTGHVNFTVADTTRKLLAGTFEFDAIDTPSKRTIRVTEGRFDLNQQFLPIKR